MTFLRIATVNPGRRWLLRVAAALCLIVSILLPILRLATRIDVSGIPVGHAEWMMGDFKSIAYYPARAFADGENPYDVGRYTARYPAPEPFRFYSPLTLVLHLPIARLPLDTAVLVQFALTVLLTGVLALVSLRVAGASADGVTAVLAVWGVLLLSRAGHWNLILGQFTVPVVLASYLAIALPPRRFVLSGLALTLALIKPSFGIPLGIIMLARGQQQAVVAGIGLFGALNLPIMAILADRSGGFTRLLQIVAGEGHVLDKLSLSLYRVDMTAFLARLIDRPIGTAGAAVVIAVVLGLAVLALRIRHGRGRGPGHVDVTEAGLIYSAMLLCTYHLGYDFLLLTWPAVGLAFGGGPGDKRLGVRRWLALGLILLLGFNYLSTYAVLTAMNAGSTANLIISSVNGAALLALFLCYFTDAIQPVWRLGQLPAPAPS